MKFPLQFDDGSVLVRTPSGQQEVLRGSLTLSGDERQLLLLMNGFTPLGNLLALVPGLARPLEVARCLVDRGLAAAMAHTEGRGGGWLAGGVGSAAAS